MSWGRGGETRPFFFQAQQARLGYTLVMIFPAAIIAYWREYEPSMYAEFSKRGHLDEMARIRADEANRQLFGLVAEGMAEADATAAAMRWYCPIK